MHSAGPNDPPAPRPQLRRPRRRARKLAVAAGALALVGAVAGCGSSDSSSDSGSGGSSEITIGYAAPIADQMLPSITETAGYFERQGLKVNVKFLQASSLLPALVSGQVQFGVIGAPSAAIAAVNGTPLQYVGQWEHHIDAQIVANDKAPTIKDLDGKTVAISSSGALSEFLTQIVNRQNGISTHAVPLGALPNQMTAFTKGSVDALSGTNPWQLGTLKAAVPSAHVITDFRTYSETLPGVGLVANAKYLSKNGPTVVKVLTALTQGVKYYKEHPTESIAVIKKQTSASTAESTAAYKTSKALFTDSLVPSLEDQKNVLAELAHSDAKAKGFDPSKLLDTSFATKAGS